MSTTPLVKITIDGVEMDVPQGSMIIEAADNAQITIPRFCYHKKLSVAANCRMCLVDVVNSRKPVPACATPVADGMVVNTKSPKAISYQKAVMEFLLINHPLDCPVCDQGGECELQDMTMGYGKDVSRYNQGKRAIEDKDIGPLISTDLTRCIQCTRCVRFGAEIAGVREMGMIHRGEHAEIATFLEGAVSSELSGNVIDLCPVGALTNKPFRYQARAWEMQQYPMISPHDCLGSNLYVHVRRNEVMRAVPRENDSLNENWLSDRDRYSVHALNTEMRSQKPLMKRQGKWQEVEWADALETLVKKLKQIRKKHGANHISALASPSSTVEELYLLQKWMRGLGSHNIDFRYHLNDFAYQNDLKSLPKVEMSLAELSDLDVILVVGSDTRQEVPLFHHRLRQAALNGVRVIYLNPLAIEHHIATAVSHLLNFTEMTEVFAYIAQEVLKVKPLSAPFQDDVMRLEHTVNAAEWQDLIALLTSEKKVVMVAGQILMGHPHLSEVMGLMAVLKKVLNAGLIVLTPGANSAGALLSGCVPHAGAAGHALGEEGLTAKAMLDPASAQKAYLLFNVEPGIDSLYPEKANEALDQADYVVAFSPFVTDYLKKKADVILPLAAYTETAGSFVNLLGQWQAWQGAAKPKGDARPGWKILRVLGNMMELPGFDYDTHLDVIKELEAHLVHQKENSLSLRVPTQISKIKGMQRLGGLPMYVSDVLARQSLPLQATPVMQNLNYVGLRTQDAKKLGVQEGEKVQLKQAEMTLVLPVKLMDIAKNCVFLPRGIEATYGFGEAYGEIEVERVES
ncbi:MAG: NADH-quinone oxidoreductase subunit NuoG [Gammaproteobacteria bacterium]|nr:NADH-quinone oxidoreductase subunit NuoG [Gammaproteobacteria bacterium]